MAVVGGRVQYSRNGLFLHESARAPQYSLLLDVTLGSLDATIHAAVLAASPPPPPISPLPSAHQQDEPSQALLATRNGSPKQNRVLDQRREAAAVWNRW